MSIIDFFAYPSVFGIGIAIAFGLVWLAVLGAWRWRGKWLWLSLAGIVLFPISIAWIQNPLQSLVNNWLVGMLGVTTFQSWVFLAYIPYVLLSGLVQEGAKLFPLAVYWWGKGRQVNPKVALAIGAMIGAGFGVCEAQWLLNTVFAYGFTWGAVSQYGFLALLPFWERFFTVLFHIGTAGIAGYGLAKGKGWQFYLLAAGLHFLANYSTIFYFKGMITDIHIEVIIAAFAIIVLGLVLLLKWRKEPELPIYEPAPPAETPPSEPSSSGTSL